MKKPGDRCSKERDPNDIIKTRIHIITPQTSIKLLMCALHHVLHATDAETNEIQTLVPRGLPTGRGDKHVNKQAPSLLWWLQGRCGGERGTAEAVSGGSGCTLLWALTDKQALALTAEGRGHSRERQLWEPRPRSTWSFVCVGEVGREVSPRCRVLWAWPRTRLHCKQGIRSVL